jgi:hypothetical protein
VRPEVAGTADDVLLGKDEELQQGLVHPDDPLGIVENHDHVLDGIQDMTSVACQQSVIQPIPPP